MATELLFYDTAVPLNQQRHAKWSIEVGTDYAFSRNVNSVLLTAAEFPVAANDYPIVFVETADILTPVVILGIENNQNLYLSEENTWKAKYIPAYVRRYPFVFSSNDDATLFTLCIDESFPGFNQEDKGTRLYNDEGKPTEYVQQVMAFLQGYQAEHLRTQQFAAKVKALDILEAMQVQITLDTGSIFSLNGFFCVNRDKLKNLPAEKLAELAKTDELEIIYTHLHSLKNFEELQRRLITAKTTPANVGVDESGVVVSKAVH